MALGKALTFAIIWKALAVARRSNLLTLLPYDD
jgi:hypothetical protein